MKKEVHREMEEVGKEGNEGKEMNKMEGAREGLRERKRDEVNKNKKKGR